MCLSYISDGPDGTSSYSIDIPDGGNATIENNIIEQGLKSENPVIIAYGEESGQPYNPGTDFMLSGNTIINDQNQSSDVGLWLAIPVVATGTDNQISGLTPEQLVRGPGTADLSGTTFDGGEGGPPEAVAGPAGAAVLVPGLMCLGGIGWRRRRAKSRGSPITPTSVPRVLPT